MKIIADTFIVAPQNYRGHMAVTILEYDDGSKRIAIELDPTHSEEKSYLWVEGEWKERPLYKEDVIDDFIEIR